MFVVSGGAIPGLANQAQLRMAQDQLGYDELKTDGDDIVVAKGAEPGEVVQAGQVIVQIARPKRCRNCPSAPLRCTFPDTRQV